jgi:serine/threonine-protein kinase
MATSVARPGDSLALGATLTSRGLTPPSHAAPATLEPGRLFDGRYRMIRRIGSGGMARVFLAEDMDLHREVAIKVLQDRYNEDAQFVERFAREARAAAGLNHPNIVAIYDRGQADGSYYIAMEYLDGETLKDVILREGPLPERRAIDIALQLLAALRFAHRREVIHRDVKPHNVMVLRDGRVKVADFGIARAGDSEMTEAGSIVGTAQYLSPEQARGQHVGPESDLYSVGVVLYEMLTGRVPFTGDSAVAIAMKHVQEPPVPPRQIVPAIPAELEAVVLRAMAKDPSRRYHSADEMGMDLDRVRKGLGVTQATAALAASDAYASRTMVAAPPAPPTGSYPVAPAAPPKRRTWPWVLVLILLAAVAALAAYLLFNLNDSGGDTPPPTTTAATTTAALVAVPDVVGFPTDGAVTTLQNAKFKVAQEHRFSSKPKDTVIKTDPAAQAQAAPGSTVTITISDGVEQVAVEDVVGKQFDSAEAILKGDGFTVIQKGRSSDSVPEGEVMDQDPPAGSKVDKGSDVTLTVSRGVPQVPVPNVLNFTENDARQTLQSAGFDVVTDQASSSKVQQGNVISQSPSANKKVDKGSQVTIVISTGPPPVTVPDVTGQNETDASNTLQDRGFKVASQDVTVTDPTQDGVVQSTDPPSGDKAPDGSTVTILVGRLSP